MSKNKNLLFLKHNVRDKWNIMNYLSTFLFAIAVVLVSQPDQYTKVNCLPLTENESVEDEELRKFDIRPPKLSTIDFPGNDK